jgi:hypothetical protein
MKKYIKPIIEVVELGAEELICASITKGSSQDVFEAEIESRMENELLEMESLIKLW